MARPPRNETGEDVPTSFPATTPRATYGQPGHDFTLQIVMEMQRSLGEMSSKLDRVVSDVKSHGEKLDTIRSQIAFVRGALWVIGALLALAITAVTAYLRYLPR